MKFTGKMRNFIDQVGGWQKKGWSGMGVCKSYRKAWCDKFVESGHCISFMAYQTDDDGYCLEHKVQKVTYALTQKGWSYYRYLQKNTCRSNFWDAK